MCPGLKCYNDVVGNATKIWALHKNIKEYAQKIISQTRQGKPHN
jgi:hypothetical protein